MIHTNCYRFKENCWKKAYAEENVLGCPSDEGLSWRIKFQGGQKNEWMDAADSLEVTCSPGRILLLLFCFSFIHNVFSLLVDCIWGEWEAWESCSQSCESGTRQRSRSYAQMAMHDGKNCTGQATDAQFCYTGPCKGN